MLTIVVTAFGVCVLLVLGAGACAALFDRPAIDLDYPVRHTAREQEPVPEDAHEDYDALLRTLTYEGAVILATERRHG